MTLGSDVLAALPELRAQAESLMTDACTITGPGSTPPTWDPGTGQYADPPGSAVYTGACRVQLPQAQVGSPVAGEAEYTDTTVVVSLPWGAPAVPVRALVTITGVGPLSDPSLVGDGYTVSGLPSRKSQATASRLACDRVTS